MQCKSCFIRLSALIPVLIYVNSVKCSSYNNNFRCACLCVSVHVQVQHALKKSDAALETLNRAIGIDPKNPLCKFHRASILFANDKYKVINTADDLSSRS